jgi:tight adherence protein B
MLSFTQSQTALVVAVAVFLALVLLLEGLFLLWQSYRGPQALRMERRLRVVNRVQPDAKSVLLKSRLLSEIPLLERWLQTLQGAGGLDRFIVQSALSWTVSGVLLVSLALGAALFWLTYTAMHQSALAALMAAGVAACLPGLYVAQRRSRRLARLQLQLPETLDLMARALRAGHAFSSSLQMVGEEMSEPIASEFRAVHDEVNFGVSLQQALAHLVERVPLTDLRYFVVAVLIQRESGGNLTQVLGNLSRLIRDRLKLLARVRVLSSEGRLSAWILGVMPFALGGLLTSLNPTFMAPLWTDPIGVAIVEYLLALMLLGALMLRKIVQIRV